MRIFRDYKRDNSDSTTNFILQEDGSWECTHGGWSGVEVEGEPTYLAAGHRLIKYDSFEQYSLPDIEEVDYE